MRTLALLMVSSLSVACTGGDGGTDITGACELQDPQIFPSTGFPLFEVINAGATTTVDISLVNGGCDLLEVTSLIIEGTNANAFSVQATFPASMDADYRSAVSVTLAFEPPAKGGYSGFLRVQSNAANEPDILLALTGAAGDDVEDGPPELVFIEDPAEVIPERGAAITRFFNVGSRSLALGEYVLDSGDGTFTLPTLISTNPNVPFVHPSLDEPFALGGGAGSGLQVFFDDSAGAHTANLTVRTYDFENAVSFSSDNCDVALPDCPERVVDVAQVVDNVVVVSTP
jgi:hypothetical protein